MVTIRPAVIEQINNQLDQTVFSKHLFDMAVNQDDFIIKITFNGSNDYEFLLKEHSKPKQGRYRFLTIESPGDIALETEFFDHENLNNARSRIHSWAHRIEEDFRLMAPNDSDLEALRQEFMNQFSGSSDDRSHFSPEEQNTVFSKLKDLEEKLEEFYKEKEATNQQLNILHQQIEILKKGVGILDKRTWLSAACNRVLDIYKEVKAAKKEVSGLLGDMENLLPGPTETQNESESDVSE